MPREGHAAAPRHATVDGGDQQHLLSDVEGKPLPFVTTADWGYLRLRKETYDDAELQQWATRVKAEGWKRGCIFFKHEEQGPLLAERLTKIIAATV